MKNRSAKKNDPSKEGNSQYQKKQRLKRGNGARSPFWMTWFENPQRPRAVAVPQ